CFNWECAGATEPRRIGTSLSAGIRSLMRRSAAGSYRYSGVDSPRGTPGGAASNSASYLSRCQTCSRYVSTSPGPPFDGGGPSVRKNFGSLIGDMYRPGCRDSVACSAVVPDLG